jgi:heat shock protein HtpX
LEANPSSGHMFIVNPLSARNMANLFSTHPPLEERIARLRGRTPTSWNEPDQDSGKRAAESTWRRLSR